jgi:MFS family permease
MALGQLLGALARVAVGVWSDRVGSRLRPMRQLALLTGGIVGATALATAFPSPLTPVLLVAAIAVTSSTNGLSFTSTAEHAGPAWAGRALGVHNTGQNLTAALVPPLMAALISATAYWPGFLLAALATCASAGLIPVARAVPAAGGAGERRTIPA